MPRRTNLTPEQRSLRARLAALELHSKHDSKQLTAAATNAGPQRLPYWEAKVDPDGELDLTERRRRAEKARSAHYARLAYKSAKARTSKSRKARAPTRSGAGGEPTPDHLPSVPDRQKTREARNGE